MPSPQEKRQHNTSNLMSDEYNARKAKGEDAVGVVVVVAQIASTKSCLPCAIIASRQSKQTKQHTEARWRKKP
jgi:hypothetical protein